MKLHLTWLAGLLILLTFPIFAVFADVSDCDVLAKYPTLLKKATNNNAKESIREIRKALQSLKEDISEDEPQELQKRQQAQYKKDRKRLKSIYRSKQRDEQWQKWLDETQQQSQKCFEKRHALVIGNSQYQEISKLKNPANDAQDMTSVLRKYGFTVMHKQDLDLRGMKKAINDFKQQLSKDGISLFYFAGHGIEVAQNNYLVPIGAGAEISGEEDVEYNAINAQLVLDKMDSAGSRVKIVILDACRNNPFSYSRSFGGGLAQMNASRGTIISYATGPRQTASDGSERNGLYTEHLLKVIQIPSLNIEEVFRRTANRVNLVRQQQVPWRVSSLTGTPFCFSSCKPQHDYPLTTKTTDSSSPQNRAINTNDFLRPKWCRSGLKGTERIICQHQKLWGVEKQNVNSHRLWRNSLSETDKVLASKELKNWIKHRNTQCLQSIESCLQVYQKRVKLLNTRYEDDTWEQINYFQRPESVYTGLKDCRVIEDPNAEIISKECESNEDYRIIYKEGGLKSWLVIKKGNKILIDLYDAVMQNAPGHFPNVSGKMAEWWYQGKTPIAFIFRIGGTERIFQQNNSQSVYKTKLLVVRLESKKACVIGTTTSSLKARKIADGKQMCRSDFAKRPGWCRSGLKGTERIICQHQKLWGVEKQNVNSHRLWRNSLSETDKVLASKELKNWIKHRNTQCLQSVESCLQVYTERVKLLNTRYENGTWEQINYSNHFFCGLVTATQFRPLNIRAEPTTNADNIIGTASKNSALSILEKTNSLWYKVKLNSGEVGYAYGHYVNITTEVSRKCGIVVTQSIPFLNIRAGASTITEKIGEASKGSALHILEKEGVWARVKLNNGNTGYAHLNYIEIQ
jgi:hypothetical protein